MLFTQTKLKGAYIIDINKMEDDRGFFGRGFCKNEFELYGLNTKIVQANVSYNKIKGTLRGLHMQLAPNEESKLIRCTRGAIFDVIVDMRENSETFLQWISVELTSSSFRMLYVPEGCAHGYMTLEDNTDVMYHVTEIYTPLTERGYRWNDPSFAIQWPMEPVVISEKDRNQPLFRAKDKASNRENRDA